MVKGERLSRGEGEGGGRLQEGGGRRQGAGGRRQGAGGRREEGTVACRVGLACQKSRDGNICDVLFFAFVFPVAACMYNYISPGFGRICSRLL